MIDFYDVLERIIDIYWAIFQFIYQSMIGWILDIKNVIYSLNNANNDEILNRTDWAYNISGPPCNLIGWSISV